MKQIELTFPATFEGESDVALRTKGAFTARADRLGDITARAGVIVLFSLMAMRFGADFAETGRVTNLLLLVSELLERRPLWTAACAPGFSRRCR